MSIQNGEIATILDQTAELLAIKGESPFRTRAYRRAARLVESMPTSVADMLKAGQALSELPGIGTDLAEKIADIAATGRFSLLERLKKELPGDLAAMAEIRSLGPKRIKLLHEELGVRSLEDLRRVTKQGRLRLLRGFGPTIEQHILAALAKPVHERRFKRVAIEGEAGSLMTYLRRCFPEGRVVAAGSFRRRCETVGDLDLLLATDQGKGAGAKLVAYENVVSVLAEGPTRTTVILRSGLQVDLRVVPAQSYGAALLYLTGSKAHNIALRALANNRGWKLNEYGLFDGDRSIGGATEAEIYRRLGLAEVPPELREDRGEIVAAKNGLLPQLIERSDIRGDLHVHSNWSDGTAPIEEMAAAAKALGYEYMAITDHSQRLSVAHGLDPDRVAHQISEIDRLNETFTDFTVLKGIEVDIRSDGRLDLPDSILDRLDVVIAAVHHKFDLARKAQTDRIVRALDNRHVSILAHPTGRLIGVRDPYDVDLDRVMEAARDRKCCVELSAEPERLDVDDIHARQAKSMNVKVAISTDAHTTMALGNMRWGIDQARRGWLETGDVINTRPLAELKKILKS